MRTAEVAGGGFAGLVLSTELARRGWTVRLHEIGSELRSFGAGIFVWENGIRVLEHLGVADEVLSGSHVAPRLEEREADGSLISWRAFPTPESGRMATMTRSLLHGALAKSAVESGVEIVTDSRVVGAREDGALVTADGRTWTADLVVGADGIRSAVRDSLYLLRRHEVFPFAVYRFLVPIGPARAAGLQFISNYWDVAERRRILFVPCNDSELYLLLGAHEDDHEVLKRPLEAEPWRSAFPGLRTVLTDLPATPRFDRYEVLTLRRWVEGRVAIIGDAAHAMPPTFGQGAGTGMINALSLAAVLDVYDDIDSALGEWEAREMARSSEIQRGAVHFYDCMFSAERHLNFEWQAPELAALHYFPPEIELVAADQSD
jgi:2-methyl-3-hydroxypyridine 5-carboxylic acid dioxygenase